MKRVLVTGANGFVGGPLCKHLQQTGWDVVAAVRKPESLSLLPVGVRGVVCGDLSSPGNLSQALNGVDSVVHLAARAHIVRDQASIDTYRLVNVTGTEHVLTACQGVGVRRFIYLSSIKAAGEGRSTPYRESDPCEPLDAYGHSKAEAESTVREWGNRTGIGTVIVRPPLVYGPGVRANFLRLLSLTGRGLPIPLSTVRNARSLIYIENLTDALARCLEHPSATGRTFFVADDDALSTPELIRRMAAHLGKPARLVPFPISVMKIMGAMLGKGGEVDRLTGSLTIDTTQIKTVLGWQPPFTVDQGLAATVQWFQERNMGGASR